MEEQRQSGSEAITYVGGLGDPPRRHAWPFIALAFLPVVAGLLLVVFWNPVRALGRSAGETIAPYSLDLISGGWSSDQKIATVPIQLSLNVGDSDQRPLDGLTLRFTKIDPAWQILGASSGNTSADVMGDTIFFPTSVGARSNATFIVTLLPTKAMDSTIELTLSPGRGTNPARIHLPSGSVATKLTADGKVRNPIESDADARLTALYDPQPTIGNLTVWQIHVANTGPVAINGIRLRFPDIPAGLELGVSSDATVLPDGQTVQFSESLVPGGQTVLQVGVTPHITGQFHIPVLVYLGQATHSLAAPNGGPPLSIDVTVG